MAKQTPPIKDNTLWYSDLNFFPQDLKESQLWLAQALFYWKKNAVQFLDSKRCREYRRLERLELNEQDYKNMIDPPTPMGKGGAAEYFAADLKANPINVHLNNIVRAKLDKIGIENQIQVNEIDKFAKSQRQKDKDKIIFQREFRQLINDLNQEIGLPPIKDSQNPYSYVQSVNQEETDNMMDHMGDRMDYIRSQIRDSQDLSLYETYVYKGDIEKAFELGIKHYVINLNKWRVKCEKFNNDLKHFNRCVGRWYTDETNGRGTIEYIEPDQIYTSHFKDKNGDDIVAWFYEWNVTFADFVRMFGTELSDEQLKEIFELNKQQGGQHNMSYTSAGSVKGSNAKIRIGQFSVLTQDAENFSEKLANNKIPVWQRKPLSWIPDKHTPNKHKSEQRRKIYNTWYSCYYVPPPGDKLSKNSQVDWTWQAQYIFNIHKDVDMYRYGIDMRYAKSTLVIWKDDRPSFTDIEQAFMPKIHNTWHKFQNCLIQDVTGMVFDQDLLLGMLNAVDEVNKTNPGDATHATGGSGVNAALEMWKMLKQGGIAWMKLRDKNGNLIVQDPSKLFVPVNSGHLDKAERYLKLILEQYNMMTVALAQNDLTEGQDAKPRTPIAGIQASLAAASNGIWFIEKPVREILIMFGERAVQHIICMLKEKNNYGYKHRWEEFKNVIGAANALCLEGIQDINPEDIGLTVDLEDTRANQQFVVELANKMAAEDKVSFDAVGLVMEQVKINYKYAYALLMLAVKQRQREVADQEELAFERQKQLQQQQLQIAIALQGAKSQGKQAEIERQGQVDAAIGQQTAHLKTESQALLKEQLRQNRISQDNNKARLEQEKEDRNTISPIQQ